MGMYKSLLGAKSLKAASMCLLTSATLSAQLQLSTVNDLKTACETSPGNIVTLTQSAKVSMPLAASTPLPINCPCKFILTNGATLELEQVNVKFAGAFSVESAGKGELKLIKSRIEGTSASISLGGDGSALQTSESMTVANAGNITITMGAQPKVELYGAFGRFGRVGFDATGAIAIAGGTRSLFSIVDMGVLSNQGVSVSGSGDETLMKVERVSFLARLGSVSLSATGSKGLLEMIESSFLAHNNSTINFAGGESGLKLSEVSFNGATSTAASIGGVSINAGSGAVNTCKVEMSSISTGNIAGNFSVSACLGGQFGGVKMEKSTVRSGGAMSFTTGAMGSSEVKENRLTSNVSISVSTGAGGNCLATPNFTLAAPLVQACTPAALMARPNTNATFTAAKSYEVYPNPSNAAGVTLELPTVENAAGHDVSVFDTNGRMIQNWKGFNNNTLKINNLPAGFYSVLIQDKANGEKVTKKFVITD